MKRIKSGERGSGWWKEEEGKVPHLQVSPSNSHLSKLSSKCKCIPRSPKALNLMARAEFQWFTENLPWIKLVLSEYGYRKPTVSLRIRTQFILFCFLNISTLKLLKNKTKPPLWKHLFGREWGRIKGQKWCHY